jgi:magnesium-transporting ATPase (P-type)
LDVSYRLIRRVHSEDTFFKVFPFDPDLKFMTTVVKLDKETYKVCKRCAHALDLSHMMYSTLDILSRDLTIIQITNYKYMSVSTEIVLKQRK